MKKETIIKNLTRAGLTAEAVTIRTAATEEAPAVRVMHNYSGLYPTPEALAAHRAAVKVAAALGLRAEARGCYTATLIYI